MDNLYYYFAQFQPFYTDKTQFDRLKNDLKDNKLFNNIFEIISSIIDTYGIKIGFIVCKNVINFYNSIKKEFTPDTTEEFFLSLNDKLLFGSKYGIYVGTISLSLAKELDTPVKQYLMKSVKTLYEANKANFLNSLCLLIKEQTIKTLEELNIIISDKLEPISSLESSLHSEIYNLTNKAVDFSKLTSYTKFYNYFMEKGYKLTGTKEGKSEISGQYRKVIKDYFEECKEDFNLISIDIFLKDIIEDFKRNSNKRTQHKAKDTKGLPEVKTPKFNSIQYPIDKINSNLWNTFAKLPPGQLYIDQIETAFDTANKRKINKQALVSVVIDFKQIQNVEISKKLSPYDKEVYTAISNIYNYFIQGNIPQNYTTLSEIYYFMEGDVDKKKKPNKTQLLKIQKSLEKMMFTKIEVNNIDEIKTNTKYPMFKYTGALLPIEMAQVAIVNGIITDTAIHLFREPPLMTFAKERNQITKAPIAIQALPLNKTDTVLAIASYLREQIAHIRNDNFNTSDKRLYSTIANNIGIKNRFALGRLPEQVKKILEHYKNSKFIKDFKETSNKDGVIIEA